MTLQLKVGKSYVARNGDTFTIRGENPGRTFPFLGTPYRPGGGNELSWREDGRYLVDGVSPADLLREATPVDHMLPALAPRDSSQHLLILADYAEQLGLALCQTIREAVDLRDNPPERTDET